METAHILIEERFWSKVDRRGPEDCWPWTGWRNADGYGEDRRTDIRGLFGKKAHRIAWALANGQRAPDGLNVCHACDNPPCCNPDHLWVGTIGDNMRDAIAKGRHISVRVFSKTHCVNGHEFTPENTRIEKTGRRCRTCHRIQERNRKRAKRAAARSMA